MATEAATRALVVEDDPNIVDLIRSNLAVRGFDTIVSNDGLRALRLLETESPDIVLLDLMLPEIDGFELCRQIREQSSVAIIVVSARGGERDKVSALNVGADDYMTKPFSIEELLARINATLRRTRPAGLATESSPAVITVADLVIDLASQQVSRAGVAVHLTPTEFALLRELAINRGKLLSHAHLLRTGLGPWLRDRDRIRPRLHPAAAGQAGDQRHAADRHSAAGRLPDPGGLTTMLRIRHRHGLPKCVARLATDSLRKRVVSDLVNGCPAVRERWRSDLLVFRLRNFHEVTRMLTEPFTDRALVFATEDDLTPRGTFGGPWKSDVRKVRRGGFLALSLKGSVRVEAVGRVPPVWIRPSVSDV